MSSLDDGIIRTIKRADGCSLVSMTKGETSDFLRVIANHDQALAVRIQNALGTGMDEGDSGRWRYELNEGEERSLREALDEATKPLPEVAEIALTTLKGF